MYWEPLKPFTQATLWISTSKTPTLPLVLPIYTKLHNHLEATGKNPKLSPQIQQAAAAALLKLRKYKTMAESNHNNTLATSMWSVTHLSYIYSTHKSKFCTLACEQNTFAKLHQTLHQHHSRLLLTEQPLFFHQLLWMRKIMRFHFIEFFADFCFFCLLIFTIF